MTEAIHADGAPAPAGPYSHATRAGDFVYLSSQGPTDPLTNQAPDSFAQQARQVFRNLDTIAHAAGASLSQAVRIGVFLRDMADFDEMNAAYLEFVSEPFPARTTVQSALKVAIAADAVLFLGEH